MRTTILAAGVCLSMVGSCFAQSSTAALTRIETRIPPQPLASALKQFAATRHMQVLFLAEDVSGLRTSAVSGDLTADETLARLLGGTRLSYRYVGANAVSIIPVSRSNATAGRVSTQKVPSRLTHPKTAAPIQRDPDPKEKGRSTTAQPRSQGSLQEVVVTGTYILGTRSIASPMSSYSRDDIYTAGASNIYEFMQTLPQALGDANPAAVGATPGGPGSFLDNGSASVGFDLRGLGPQATLVLVNGQRVAAGNNEGNFVDVSMIPLNAISGVDIVKDSASATYGSDAVGGVVNIRTLQNFSGSETAVKYGFVTSGGMHDIQADETWGTSWGAGAAVLGYEYDDQTPVDSSSKSFTANLPSPYTLLPEQTRHGVYGSLTEQLSPGFKLNGFVLYGQRSDLSDEVTGGLIYRSDTEADSYIASIGAERTFTTGSVATGSFDYSGNDTKTNEVTKLFGTSNPFQKYNSPYGRSTSMSLNLGYSDLFGRLPGGQLGLAAGAQIRRELFSSENVWLASPSYERSRNIIAEYLEVRVPMVKSLDLDVSVRHEHYSDFGSTTNPKVGLLWRPTSSVSVGGTYSTSFIAPSLNELVPSTFPGTYLPLPDPMKTGPCSFTNSANRQGCSIVLAVSGGNPSLGPEKADTWTTSVRIHPERIQGLHAEIAFYAIEERGLINTAFSFLPSTLDCLQYAAELGPTVVSNITAQQANEIAPLALNPFGLDKSAVSFLCDGRDHNLSELSSRGLDLDIRYSKLLGNARFNTTLSGTRVLQYRTKFTPGTPTISFLDRPYNPVGLRVRLGETVAVHALVGSVFLSYVGPYTNNIVAPPQRISSWTTVDLQTTYSRGIGRAAFKQLSLTFGVNNLMDRNPPFVFNSAPGFPVDFDGANASPLGRFVYVELNAKL